MPINLEAIARAYMERERQRVGIPQQEQAAAESETAQIMRQLQAARIMQQLEAAPGEQERDTEAHTVTRGLREAQTEESRARAAALRTPKPPEETPEARLQRIEAEATARARGTRTGAPPVGPSAPREGVGKWAYNTQARQPEYVSDAALKAAPPGLYVDVTSGRKGQEESEVSANINILVSNAEERLDRYMATMTGTRRYIPAQLDPEKMVVFDSYRNALQSLGQLFGRSVLKDNRVSEEDRRVYSGAIGSASQIINVLDPEEAKRRMDLLKSLVADYETKYGFDGGVGGAGAANDDADPLGILGGGR